MRLSNILLACLISLHYLKGMAIGETLTIRVEDENDDVEILPKCHLDGNNLDFGRQEQVKLSFTFRVEGQFPSGKIQGAYLKLKASNGGSGLLAYNIKGSVADHSIPDRCYSPLSNEMTSAMTTWSFPEFVKDEEYISPDISKVITEAMQRENWLQRQTLQLFLLFNDTESCSCDSSRMVYSFEGAGTYIEKIPRLEIFYQDKMDLYQIMGDCKQIQYIIPLSKKASESECRIFGLNSKTAIIQTAAEGKLGIWNVLKCVNRLSNNGE